MAPSNLADRQAVEVVAKHSAEPLAGVVMSVLICLISVSVISGFIVQRALSIRVWSRLPFAMWLVFLIYIDSYFFVIVTAVLQFALGVNTSIQICDGAILLCLVCYVTTKILIYLFLVERAHIVRGNNKPRLKSKLYLFNSAGMLGIYVIIAILNFIFRITRLEDDLCIIGMQKVSMVPLITFDAIVNVYLTILFLIPIKKLYSFRNTEMQANSSLRVLAVRTLIGAVCTLISSIVNLTVLMVLNGEPGWVCLMCCNSDILFSAAVIQWVTSKDSTGGNTRVSEADPNQRATDISLGRDRGHDVGSGIHNSNIRKGAYGSRPSPQADSDPIDYIEHEFSKRSGTYDKDITIERGPSSRDSQSEMLRPTTGEEPSSSTTIVGSPNDEAGSGIMVTTTIISRESWRGDYLSGEGRRQS